MDLISVSDVEKVVNSGAAVRYSRAEILFLLKVSPLVVEVNIIVAAMFYFQMSEVILIFLLVEE